MWLTPEKKPEASSSLNNQGTAEPAPPPAQTQDSAQSIQPLSSTSDTNAFRLTAPDEIRVWKASKGEKLENVLSKWSSIENIELAGPTEEDIALNKDVFISGTFQNAIDVLFSKGLKQAPQYALETQPHFKLVVD